MISCNGVATKKTTGPFAWKPYSSRKQGKLNDIDIWQDLTGSLKSSFQEECRGKWDVIAAWQYLKGSPGPSFGIEKRMWTAKEAGWQHHWADRKDLCQNQALSHDHSSQWVGEAFSSAASPWPYQVTRPISVSVAVTEIIQLNKDKIKFGKGVLLFKQDYFQHGLKEEIYWKRIIILITSIIISPMTVCRRWVAAECIT